VVYIGDSTSDGEVQADYVPDAGSRLPAQLARVGVQQTLPEVSGARSIVETWHGIPNAATVAGQHVSAGFRGCWILALGTNDAADVKAGSNVGLPARIAHMMAIIGDQPVMWVNVTTLVNSGYYAKGAMQQWNLDLLAACRRHPLMRVFDWAAEANPSWFIPDGIHYTSAGYVQRTRLIAEALVKAFPRYGASSSSCLVG
jgi:lysophospholipase L1-like esterase